MGGTLCKIGSPLLSFLLCSLCTPLQTLEDIEDTDNAFEKIELNELKAQIQYAINTLPDYQKEVIILRFYYDLKIREIATITKASASTVKSRLQQGIKKLERYLADFRGGDNV